MRNADIHFRYPHTDSCAKCDALSLSISACTSSEDKKKLEADLQEHQDSAKTGYNTFHYYNQELSRKSWEAVRRR